MSRRRFGSLGLALLTMGFLAAPAHAASINSRHAPASASLDRIGAPALEAASLDPARRMSIDPAYQDIRSAIAAPLDLDARLLAWDRVAPEPTLAPTPSVVAEPPASDLSPEAFEPDWMPSVRAPVRRPESLVDDLLEVRVETEPEARGVAAPPKRTFPVPEPSSIILVVTGAIGLFFRSRMRRDLARAQH
jgi:hypothetical protein